MVCSELPKPSQILQESLERNDILRDTSSTQKRDLLMLPSPFSFKPQYTPITSEKPKNM